MALAEALSRGDWAQIRRHTQNAFEPLIATRIPSVTDLKARLMAAGAMAAVMSGSGTSVVGLFADAMAARRALKMVRPFAAWGVVAHSVRRSIVLRWGRKG
jgi:4-diphosphocytidyl-2-C-methyl-D-erythritol kinase